MFNFKTTLWRLPTVRKYEAKLLYDLIFWNAQEHQYFKYIFC